MKKAIGIDLGGTKILGGVINEYGEIEREYELPTGKNIGKRKVLDRIGQVIEELLYEDIIGIGIGSPGFIDTKEGKVLKVGGNIKDWANTDIKGEMEKKFSKIPIFVGNDANIAALCERWIGAGRDFNSFVMITLGTGVGGAIYTEKGGIWTGQNYEGAELGHMILYPNGRLCNCGQKGCAERYITGTALEISYEEVMGEKLKGREIFKRQKEGDKIKTLIDQYCENLGIYLCSLKNIFDPEGIIIGGGIINSREYWWDKMIYYYRACSNNPDNLKIVPAQYLNDSGMIGAGKIVFESLE